MSELCGIHAGDGYLRFNDKRKELDISGNIEEKEYYDNHVIPLFKKTFNIELSGKLFPHRNTYGFVIRDLDVLNSLNNDVATETGSSINTVITRPFCVCFAFRSLVEAISMSRM